MIINEAQYNKAPIKVLWILKEPWSSDPDFNVFNWIGQYLPVDRILPKRIAVTSYCILKGLKSAHGIKAEDFQVKSALRDIAIVEVSNIPGTSRTTSTRLKLLYRGNRGRICTEVKDADPDIIIFGGTFGVFWDDFKPLYFNKNLSKMKNKSGRITNGYLQEDGNGPLLIEASHPTAFMTNAQYYNSILETVDIWESDNYTLVRKW